MGKLTADLSYPVPRGKIVGGSTSINGTGFQRPRSPTSTAGSPAGTRVVLRGGAPVPAQARARSRLRLGGGPRERRPDARQPQPRDGPPCDHVLLRGVLRARLRHTSRTRTPSSAGLRADAAKRPRWAPLQHRDHVSEPDPPSREPVDPGEHDGRPGRLRGHRRPRGRGRRRRRLEGKEIVLCAGALQTPQLLAPVGHRLREELDEHGIGVVSEPPGVGKNLMDHPDVEITWRPSARSAPRSSEIRSRAS